MEKICSNCIYSYDFNHEYYRVCRRFPSTFINEERIKFSIGIIGFKGARGFKNIVNKNDTCGEFKSIYSSSSSSSSYFSSSSSSSSCSSSSSSSFSISSSCLGYIIIDEGNDKQILLVNEIGNIKIYYNGRDEFTRLTCWTTSNRTINIRDKNIANNILKCMNIDYIIE